MPRYRYPNLPSVDVSKLVSAVRVDVGTKARRFSNPKGPEGRIEKLRKTVTALVQHERIELNFHRAQEARQYAERLISEAIRHGDTHVETMETADFWLLEKQLVHKLFKVLAPRFQDFDVSYTRMYRAPKPYPGDVFQKAILELRGNPFPALKRDTSNKLLIHNVLLDAARQEHNQLKYSKIAEEYSKSVDAEKVIPDKVS